MRQVCRNGVPAGWTGLSLSTWRYEAQRPAADAHFLECIIDLALERRRFGYRRIWQLLRREGVHVNHKRVYRLYHLSGLGVKRRRRRKELAAERFTVAPPGGTQPVRVDGFRHGHAGQRSQDQVPCLCGRLHKGVSDN